MLELHHVSVRYGDTTALEDVSVSFRPGEVLTLIGPNGSGKSTLCKAACGILPCAAGSVKADGIALDSLDSRERARKIAYLPQSRSVPDITAGRMVLHGRFPWLSWPRQASAEDRRIALRALEQTGGADLFDRPLRSLSGGERQKVYIAMALAQETDTVLLDEPTSFLDIRHQFQVAELARRLTSLGKAVVMVLHDLPLALETGDRTAVLSEGKLVSVGDPADLMAGDLFPRVFGVSLEAVQTASGTRYVCEQVKH